MDETAMLERTALLTEISWKNAKTKKGLPSMILRAR
jgi:hypothetical protein